MSLIEQAGLGALRLIDPERAHRLALAALNAGLGPKGGPVTSARLATQVAGLPLPNPVGIAAGFDKNAEAVGPILAAGPGFLEIGAVTPRPQPGNPRPRLFRLAQDRAAINRFGFNNQGMEAVGRRLAARGPGVVGVNLGANKDTTDKAEDYAAVLAHLYPFADFFTVNVSSPNTERLRDLQGRAALDRLLSRVTGQWADLGRAKPLFLKIAPDLTEAELADIAELAEGHALSGLIATNTTLSREGLRSPRATEAGGLSGAPLKARAQAVTVSLRRLTGGRLPLIGVGGIATAEDAYARIRAGASAVQLYTAMVYAGISLPGRIARGLDALLARDGFGSVAEAVGVDG
ncbi:MAG: quinone-dependent dihydroorotate dehydrogenase [Thermohalobaculum sp.]|nr:quinone-dependent dihydroorotate dehydrogenase [Thermohalobaculum sp.]